MSEPKTEAPTGPYSNTRTVTLKFTPFELSMTTDEKASHPPQPCGCKDKPDVGAVLHTLMTSAMHGHGPTTMPQAEPTD